MIKYRILSFDGGGIRGLVTTVLLERLTREVPALITKADLLAGTSTGGIIALGLAFGKSPTDLRQLYYQNGEAIFDDSFVRDIRDLGGLAGAKYDNDNLKALLSNVFGTSELRDLAKKVLIPSFDLDNQNRDDRQRRWAPKFFHNFEGEDFDGQLGVLDVALYTSAAPTYFPSYGGYIDGGVVANNPSMAALAQTQDPRALITDRPQLSEISLLSVGTGTSLYYIKGQRLDWGELEWAKPIVTLMLEANMGVADYQCRQVMGEQYHRLAPIFDPGTTIELDDWRRRDDLIAFAAQVDITTTVQWLTTVQW
jgi:patatin-like phospholipase/acyl hydrolase